MRSAGSSRACDVSVVGAVPSCRSSRLRARASFWADPGPKQPEWRTRVNPRNDLEQEAPDELVGPEHGAPALSGSGVAVAEGHSAVVEALDAQVRDRGTEEIETEVLAPRVARSGVLDVNDRRFLLHVVPPGFMRIRHFGLLVNGRRKVEIQRCRELLKADPPAPPPPPETSTAQRILRATGIAITRCRRCTTGTMFRVAELPSPRRSRATPHRSRPPPLTRTAACG